MTQVSDPIVATVRGWPVAFTPSGHTDYVASAPMPFEDYLALDYEHGMSEWVCGEARLYVSNTDDHQRMLDFLTTVLSIFLEVTGLGSVRSAGYAMQAQAGGSGREPDLVFVAAEHADRIQSSHLVGPPDLAVEIVSPDSVTRDHVEKFEEYEAAGISEYWIVDSRPGKDRAEFFVLRDGVYQPAPAADGIYRSTVLEGFWLRLSWLWEPEPRPLLALRELLGERLQA